MKAFWLSVAAIFIAVPAFAGTVDSTYGNTLVATDAKGDTSTWLINPDKTYTITGADGTAVDGTWKIAGDKFCITPDMPAGAAEACFDYVDGKTVGDSWDVKSSSGETLTVAIRAGR